MISSDVHEKALCQIYFQIVTLKPMTTQFHDLNKLLSKAASFSAEITRAQSSAYIAMSATLEMKFGKSLIYI